MPFIKNLQEKPIKTRERILWGGVIIVAIILFSFLIWQQKKQLSSLTIPSKDIPKLELSTEEIGRLKGYIGQLNELEKQPQIPGVQIEDIERIKGLKEEDLEKILSEDDKKTLGELIKKIQEKKILSEDDKKTLGELIKKIQENIESRASTTK